MSINGANYNPYYLTVYVRLKWLKKKWKEKIAPRAENWILKDPISKDSPEWDKYLEKEYREHLKNNNESCIFLEEIDWLKKVYSLPEDLSEMDIQEYNSSIEMNADYCRHHTYFIHHPSQIKLYKDDVNHRETLTKNVFFNIFKKYLKKLFE